jgi:glycerol 3-phosphatase-2
MGADAVTSAGTGADGVLIAGFKGVVCDLDGVVYRGHDAVPHAVESLRSVISAGVRLVFATNNASRTPVEVAAHLERLGLPGSSFRVVTSAQAGAQQVAQRFGAGSRVLAIGGPGVGFALEEAGLVPVSPSATRSDHAGDAVVAVLQGYGARVAWSDLAEAAYAIQAGALWVATNVDSTLPTERGLAPGNGALVGAVRAAVDTDPVVVGKPYAPLYELSAAVLGSSIDRTLAIGDRLDTDIAGAAASGMASLFVFGGVDGWVKVAGVAHSSRPRYVATDLRSLHLAYLEPVQDPRDASRWVCGEASASVSAAGILTVSRDSGLNERLRAALAALWHAVDTRAVTVDPLCGEGAELSRDLDRALAPGR